MASERRTRGKKGFRMYSFDSRVRYSECSEDGRLSILALVNYLQDCSTFHSEAVGLGLDYMRKRHFAWFIAAWQIEIDELPSFDEPITTSTWCYDIRRLMASRNFTIARSGESPCVRADSLWFAFDTQERRPVRVPEGQEAYLTGESRLDMPTTQRKIAVRGLATETTPILVVEQHLDTNRHVNNAQYISMALDALAESGDQVDLHRIAVQYKNMALLGDTIVPRIHNAEHGKTIDLASPEGKSYAIVKLESE